MGSRRLDWLVQGLSNLNKKKTVQILAMIISMKAMEGSRAWILECKRNKQQCRIIRNTSRKWNRCSRRILTIRWTLSLTIRIYCKNWQNLSKRLANGATSRSKRYPRNYSRTSERLFSLLKRVRNSNRRFRNSVNSSSTWRKSKAFKMNIPKIWRTIPCMWLNRKQRKPKMLSRTNCINC